jgi:hypothetical protein
MNQPPRRSAEDLDKDSCQATEIFRKERLEEPLEDYLEAFDQYLGNRKADFLVRLWDHRIMTIECKVSNSATNSVKRLNNDAAAKAEAWIKDFGTRQVVPAAVLSGVYKLHNLEDAQDRGLALFWAHDLKALTDWIATTRD